MDVSEIAVFLLLLLLLLIYRIIARNIEKDLKFSCNSHPFHIICIDGRNDANLKRKNRSKSSDRRII